MDIDIFFTACLFYTKTNSTTLLLKLLIFVIIPYYPMINGENTKEKNDTNKLNSFQGNEQYEKNPCPVKAVCRYHSFTDQFECFGLPKPNWKKMYINKFNKHHASHIFIVGLSSLDEYVKCV